MTSILRKSSALSAHYFFHYKSILIEKREEKKIKTAYNYIITAIFDETQLSQTHNHPNRRIAHTCIKLPKTALTEHGELIADASAV